MAKLSEWQEQAEQQAAMPPPVIEGDVVEYSDPGDDALTALLNQIGTAGGFNYTSDHMEEDFSVAVELMLETGTYLKILRDLVRRFGVFSVQQEKDFKEHVEKVEEFTGQWEG